MEVAEVLAVNDYIKQKHTALYLAVNHHRTHKNTAITFVNMPYLVDIYRDTCDKQVLMKSTQSGITEWLIVKTIEKTKYRKRNVFYVMPTDKLKNQFVCSRFDQSISYTPLYRGIFRDSTFDNMSIKQVGSASVFFAVSNSRNNFTSFPADDLIIDELDECNLENIEMAPERLAFSEYPEEIRVANPTYPGLGIDFEFKKSDQKYWNIKCDCGHWFNPDFFTHVVKKVDQDEFFILDKDFEFESKPDVRLICDKCHKPVFRYGMGEWINSQRSVISGRQLNQLFSSRKKIRDMVIQFDEGLANETKMQRFHNGTLGLPYVGTGAQISDDIIDGCIKDYGFVHSTKDPCLIGMDVGKKIHTIVCKLISNSGNYKLQVIFAGELFFSVTKEKIDISELVDLTRRYRIVMGLIDSRPEDRLARMISQNFPNIWRCSYLTENPKDVADFQGKIYKTDRTSSMDGVKEQMFLENIILPKNIDRVQGFREQLKAPIRIYEEKEADNGRYVWREGNNPDHYFHALNYVNIAKKLLLSK